MSPREPLTDEDLIELSTSTEIDQLLVDANLYNSFKEILMMSLEDKPEVYMTIYTDDFNCTLQVIDGISMLCIHQATNLDELAGSIVDALFIVTCSTRWSINATITGYESLPLDVIPVEPMLGETLPRIIHEGLAYMYRSQVPVVIEPGKKLYTMIHVPADHEERSWLQYVQTLHGIDVYMDNSDWDGFCFMCRGIPTKAIC